MYRHWRRIAAIVAVLVLLAGVAPQPAEGYARNGGRFRDSRIGDGTLSICFDPGFTYNNRAAINRGVRMWGTVINFVSNSIGSCANGQDWYANIVIHSWSPGICGGFIPVAYVPEGSLTWDDTQVEIYFNASCNWWTNETKTEVPAGKLDLYSVAAHEAGHALGLNHSSDTEYDTTPNTYELMDFNVNSAECNQFIGRRVYILADDDRRGMQNVYPSLSLYGVWPANVDCYL